MYSRCMPRSSNALSGPWRKFNGHRTLYEGRGSGRDLDRALLYPVLSALALTAVAAWLIQEFRICETLSYKKWPIPTPPGIIAVVASR